MEECYPMAFDEHYANMMSDMFFSFINILGSTKDIDYISIDVKRYIARLAPKMVVQLCLHNVATMKNAVAILVGMATYSKGCVAHCLNLLRKDWRKQQ